MLRNMFLLSSVVLTAACGDSMKGGDRTVVLPQEIRFCDIAERRRYTAEEWAWRNENAPVNLRRDERHNAAMREFCSDTDETS